MSVSSKRPFSRDQRTTIVYGMLVFVVIVVVLQLWLLTATMNAWLGGDDTVVWPAAGVSAVGLALNVGPSSIWAGLNAGLERRNNGEHTASG